MNGCYATTNYIGALGEYPIYDYITTTSNNLATYIIYTSNDLFNRFQPTSNLIHTNAGNTIIVSGDETFFLNNNNLIFSKVANDGTLQVYHNLDVTLPTRTAGWWNVHNELAQEQRDLIGLRFDVTNLQLATSGEGSLGGAVAKNTADILLLDGSMTLAGGAIIILQGQMLNKQDNLTFNNPLSKTGTNVSIDLSSYNNGVDTSNYIAKSLTNYITSNALLTYNYTSSNTVQKLINQNTNGYITSTPSLTNYITSNALLTYNYTSSNAAASIAQNIINQNTNGYITSTPSLTNYITSNALLTYNYASSNTVQTIINTNLTQYTTILAPIVVGSTILTVSDNSSYSYVAFTATSGTITFSQSTVCDILIVGGGGGGGNFMGGGGGGGGVIYKTGATVPPGTYTIAVGAGGAPNLSNGSTGSPSTAFGGTAYGGGGGGGPNSWDIVQNGFSGGSGGGGNGQGSGAVPTGGIATTGSISGSSILTGAILYGSAGGVGSKRTSGDLVGGGGGGGAGVNCTGGAGIAAPTAGTGGKGGGNGGDGIQLNITGNNLYWGGGGGGGCWYGIAGNGGSGGGGGGGGAGTSGSGGTGGVTALNSGANGGSTGGVGGANTGGGGGGCTYNSTGTGTGGNGIVIIRFLSASVQQNWNGLVTSNACLNLISTSGYLTSNALLGYNFGAGTPSLMNYITSNALSTYNYTSSNTVQNIINQNINGYITSAQGLTGATGAKGDTGLKGDQGLKGDTGLTGDKGDKGDTGEGAMMSYDHGNHLSIYGYMVYIPLVSQFYVNLNTSGTQKAVNYVTSKAMPQLQENNGLTLYDWNADGTITGATFPWGTNNPKLGIDYGRFATCFSGDTNCMAILTWANIQNKPAIPTSYTLPLTLDSTYKLSIDLSGYLTSTALNSLNAGNITLGTLLALRGGTGCTSLSATHFDTTGGILSIRAGVIPAAIDTSSFLTSASLSSYDTVSARNSSLVPYITSNALSTYNYTSSNTVQTIINTNLTQYTTIPLPTVVGSTISTASDNAAYSYVAFTATSGTITFSQSTVCDILMVGGGGGGGNYMGGGGGGGGVIYKLGATVPPGSYTIAVGAGGAPNLSSGSTGGSSTAFGGTAFGGGGGGGTSSWDTVQNGFSGGSGGGGNGQQSGAVPTGGTATTGSVNGSTILTGATLYGSAGGVGSKRISGDLIGGGGGGGAGVNCTGATGVAAPTAGTGGKGGGNGGDGIQLNITGNNLYWGGGGGGGCWYGIAGNGGLGGGGGGGGAGISGSGGTAGVTALNSGTNGGSTGGVGGANTGGGGGGSTFNSTGTGTGGNGIVIIRFLSASVQQNWNGLVTSNVCLNLVSTSGYLTSNALLGYGYGSGTISLTNYITSNALFNILTPYTTSNSIVNMGYITSNVLLTYNYVSSNIVQNIINQNINGYISSSPSLTNYITSNVLLTYNYTSSNTVQNIINQSLGNTSNSLAIVNNNLTTNIINTSNWIKNIQTGGVSSQWTSGTYGIIYNNKVGINTSTALLTGSEALQVSGDIKATGNVTSTNGDLIASTGNITSTNGAISAKGNITTNNGAFVGSGASLTNIPYSAISTALTYTLPLLNTTGVITVKYDNTTIGINANNQLCIIGGGGSSQWVTSGTDISYLAGNVNIGSSTGLYGSSLTVKSNLNVYDDINNGYVGLYTGSTLYPGSVNFYNAGKNLFGWIGGLSLNTNYIPMYANATKGCLGFYVYGNLVLDTNKTLTTPYLNCSTSLIANNFSCTGNFSLSGNINIPGLIATPAINYSISATNSTLVRTTDNLYAYYAFNQSGTITIPSGFIGTCDILIVGGGGGGGNAMGGGGGGGGVIYKLGATVPPGSYTIVVGSGGSPNLSAGSTGGNSTAFGGTAYGGGGGGGTTTWDSVQNGFSGGSGGGGNGQQSGAVPTGGTATTGSISGSSILTGATLYGSAGGLGSKRTNSGLIGGGGGGGAGVNCTGGPGIAGPAGADGSQGGGNGGDGIQLNITGNNLYWGGGGGGGCWYGGGGNGGKGGGGGGGLGGGQGGSSGTGGGISLNSGANGGSTGGVGGANTGGGGGGCTYNSTGTGTGGNGIVIIRFQYSPAASVHYGNVDTVSTPSFTWSGDTLTGLCHPAVNNVAVVCAGNPIAVFSASGITCGSITSTGTIATNSPISTSSTIFATGTIQSAAGISCTSVSSTGNIVATGGVVCCHVGTNGFCQLESPNANCGYMGIYDGGNTRQGYVGYIQSDSYNYLVLGCDAAYAGWYVNKALTVNSWAQFNSTIEITGWADWGGISSLGINANWDQGDVQTIPYSSDLKISLKAHYGILGKAMFANSDSRMKNNINNLTSNHALETIMNLSPSTYTFNDNYMYGSNVYGVIAQNVIDIVPSAVIKHSGVISDILRYANYSSNIITFSSNIYLNTSNIIEIIDENSKTYKATITSNIDNFSYLIDFHSGNINTSNIFVYGTEHNDVHSVDYNQLTTLNIGATQDLYNIVLDLQTTVCQLKDRVSYLENILTSNIISL